MEKKRKGRKKKKKGGNDQFAMTTKYGPAVCDSEGMTFPWLWQVDVSNSSHLMYSFIVTQSRTKKMESPSKF